MKSINFICASDSELDGLLKESGLSADKEYLVRVHTGIHNSETIMPFVNRILEKLPKAKIIGSSTSGVIFKGEIITDHCLVSVTEFESTSIRTFMTPLSDGGKEIIDGIGLANKVINELLTEQSKLMLTFFAHPFVKINDFVDGINENAKNVQIIGGFANTQEVPFVNMQKTGFVFHNDGVSGRCAVFAAIDSEKLSVNSNIIYATEPVGETHTITDADGMIIRKIDGENAVTWYENQLGIKLSEKKNFGVTAAFPIVRVDYGNIPWDVAYSSQTGSNCAFEDEPDPVIYVPSEVKTGEKIRMSYSGIQKTIEVCEKVCADINSKPAEVLFGYSCVSRQVMFSDCAKWELMPFAHTNLCGALVMGELGTIDGLNCYCNYSFTSAAMAENDSVIKLDTKALRENIDDLFGNQEDIKDDIIKYLISNNQDIPEEHMHHREAEDTLFTDADTGLGNITKFAFDFNQKKFDKICMITIRNENLLKAFLSESKFKVHFNHCHKSISDFIDDANYDYYIYKGTSLIITGSENVSDDKFVEKMNAVQTFISDFKFSEFIIVSEFSVVMHEENMLKKAELTLVRMKDTKKRFMVYTADLELEEFSAHKMKMIMIISEAILNDRVIPYFQGIRDNVAKNINMYESLMRISDKDGKIYTPYYFLDISKEYGYYADLSYMMISKTLNLFRDRNEIVTVNMSISDIYNYKIVNFILDFLKNAPHPENFIFELTETEEIEDYQIIFDFTEQIHEAGGKIAIDDFGSGFSSIVNIFKVKSDYIKIDGEIVKNITKDIYAREFLEMIAQWAKRHGKEIIAEFVETEGIQEIVEEYFIRFSQGYMFSKPSENIGNIPVILH